MLASQHWPILTDTVFPLAEMFIEVNMFSFMPSWILFDSKQTFVIKSCNFFSYIALL